MKKINDTNYEYRGGVVSSLVMNLNYILPSLGFTRPEVFLGCLWDISISSNLNVPQKEYLLSAIFAERVKKLFDATIHCQEGINWHSIETKLTQEKPVIIAVDNYYLEYRPAFRRVHAGRTIILNSYDVKNNMVELIDLWPPASQVTISLNALLKAWQSQNEHGPNDDPFFSGYPINRAIFDLVVGENKPNFSPKTLFLILQEDIAKLRLSVHDERYYRGLTGLYIFKASLEGWNYLSSDEFNTRCTNIYLQLLNLVSHRIFMRNLFYHLAAWLNNNSLYLLAESVNNCVKQWEYTRNLFAKFYHLDKRKLIQSLSISIENLMQMESCCIEKAEVWLINHEKLGYIY